MRKFCCSIWPAISSWTKLKKPKNCSNSRVPSHLCRSQRKTTLVCQNQNWYLWKARQLTGDLWGYEVAGGHYQATIWRKEQGNGYGTYWEGPEEGNFQTIPLGVRLDAERNELADRSQMQRSPINFKNLHSDGFLPPPPLKSRQRILISDLRMFNVAPMCPKRASNALIDAQNRF